jgi:hypothetical protein
MLRKVTGIGFLTGENQPTFFVQKILPLLGDDLPKEFLQFLNAHLSDRLHAPSPTNYFAAHQGLWKFSYAQWLVRHQG